MWLPVVAPATTSLRVKHYSYVYYRAFTAMCVLDIVSESSEHLTT